MGVAAAEAFANYFSGVFLEKVPLLRTDNCQDRDICNNSCYVDIAGFEVYDVSYGINKLKVGSSIGPDHVPPALLKYLKQFLLQPLCYLFNLALKTGVYPKQWKLSRVTPIPKGSNKTNVEEHRPIAIMATVAKTFEHVLHKYIYRQTEMYLVNQQHGFRAKRSVDSNLLTLVDFISSKVDRGNQVDVLYFDFKKAFDRVDNDILLLKLSNMGFTPRLLRLFADYLRDRQQFVRLGIYESNSYHTRSGVSQGSILGPLLFLIMINDLPSVLKHSKCLLYADDLKIYAAIRSNEDCLALQADIEAIHDWSRVNRMEFNLDKCQVMTFGRMRQPVYANYKLGDTILQRNTTVKDLGVAFDQKLTFHEHVISVAKESFRKLGFVLRNTRDFQSQHVIKLLYNTLVRSKLESSAAVWNPHESKYVLILEKVQKTFLRCIYRRVNGYYPYMYPTLFLLGCLGYNSLELRRKVQQILVVLKIIDNKIDAPDLHNELLRIFVPDNYCRNRRHQIFAAPLGRTVARNQSPLLRTLNVLNRFLDSKPECDMFMNDRRLFMLECLRFCENDG